MPKARHIYTAVIRSALTYGAALWHQPAKRRSRDGTAPGKARGLASKLAKYQNQGLRTVLGAFKATPTRSLETEAYISPLDLWLNGRLACFQARLERTGIATQIREACSRIRSKLRSRAPRQRRRREAGNTLEERTTPGVNRKTWTEQWTGKRTGEWDERQEKLVLRDWQERWQAENRRIGRDARWSTGREDTEEAPGRSWPHTAQFFAGPGMDLGPNKGILKLHTKLRKAESAIIVQARTGCIGLTKFLYSHNVPGFESAQCRCGAGEETPRHLALFCKEEKQRQNQLRSTKGHRLLYHQLTGTIEGVQIFAKWLMQAGRIGQFKLAQRLLYAGESAAEEEEGEEEVEEREG
jgi:hypothetical protein